MYVLKKSAQKMNQEKEEVIQFMYKNLIINIFYPRILEMGRNFTVKFQRDVS